MLNHFIRTEVGRTRHLATPVGSHLDGYLRSRLEQGFAKDTVHSDLRWATAFGEYLAESGPRRLDELDDATLTQFVVTSHPILRESGEVPDVVVAVCLGQLGGVDG